MRQNCDFLQVNFTNSEKQKAHSYQCGGCKDTWQEERCVIKHNIKKKEIFFCLNCDDLITNKANVLDSDWKLLDNDGYIRRDV